MVSYVLYLYSHYKCNLIAINLNGSTFQLKLVTKCEALLVLSLNNNTSVMLL